MILFDPNKSIVISGKMDVFTQLAVARKLAVAFPILSMIIDSKKSSTEKKKPLSVLVIQALAMLTDDESDFVVSKCLNLVKRKTPEGEFPIYNKGVLTFMDISMEDVLEITAEIVVDNLGNFLVTALGKQEEAIEEER